MCFHHGSTIHKVTFLLFCRDSHLFTNTPYFQMVNCFSITLRFNQSSVVLPLIGSVGHLFFTTTLRFQTLICFIITMWVQLVIFFTISLCGFRRSSVLLSLCFKIVTCFTFTHCQLIICSTNHHSLVSYLSVLQQLCGSVSYLVYCHTVLQMVICLTNHSNIRWSLVLLSLLSIEKVAFSPVLNAHVSRGSELASLIVSPLNTHCHCYIAQQNRFTGNYCPVFFCCINRKCIVVPNLEKHLGGEYTKKE